MTPKQILGAPSLLFAFQGKSFALGKHLLNSCFCHALSLLVGGKDTTFPRNFQGFREKILEKGEENEKNRRLPELRAAY